MTLPALRALRSLLPEAHITLATRSFAQGFLMGRILSMNCWSRIGTRAFSLKRVNGEVASSIWRSCFPMPSSRLIARLAGIPTRMGYATERRGFLLSHPLTTPSWRAERHESSTISMSSSNCSESCLTKLNYPSKPQHRN